MKKLLFVYFCILFFAVSLSSKILTSFADVEAGMNTSVLVAPGQNSLQFDFASRDGNTTDYPQATPLTYDITYGASASAGVISTTVITADFSNDLADGVDLLTYVPNSATNGYNGAQPVIDLVNHKITWTIHNLPGGTTDQLISFQLETTSNYTQTITKNFTVKVSLRNEYFTFPDQSITQSYLYIAPPVIISTPTPMPGTSSGSQTTNTTNTSSSSNNSSPTSSGRVNKPIYFKDIAVREITSSLINLHVTASKNSVVTVHYGTSLQMDQLFKFIALQSDFDLPLDNLKPDTQYYVTVTIRNSNQSVTSEIYTFRTAKVSQAPQVNPNTFTFVSNGVFLFTPTYTANNKQMMSQVILPDGLMYDFRFQIAKPNEVKKIEAIIRNKSVLGAASNKPIAENTTIISMVRLENGIFQGRVKTPATLGVYEMYARIYDSYGNITEQKIADLHVSPPITISDAQTQKTIEDAQVYIYYFDIASQSYQLISKQFLSVNNPAYTNRYGQVALALPAGKYKLKVTAIGFEQKEVAFEIGTKESQDYPTIALIPKPFSLFIMASYYGAIAGDIFSSSTTFLKGLSNSVRFFELSSMVTTTLFVLLTFVAFLARIRVPAKSLFSYFSHLSNVSIATNRQLLKGKVCNAETHEIVPNAEVFLLDTKTHTVLQRTQANNKGLFQLTHLANAFEIEIVGQGYKPGVFLSADITTTEFGVYMFVLKKHDAPISIYNSIKIFINKSLSMLFELLLMASFISEVTLGYTFGFDKVWLLILASGVNLFIWLLHLTHQRNVSEVF